MPFTDLPGLRFLVASDLLQVSDTSSDLLIVVGCDEAPDWTSCRLTCCQAGLEHVFDSRPTSYAANDLFHFRHRTHKSNAESRILLDRSRERSPFALTARECAGPQPILLEVFDNHCRIGQSDSSSSLRSAFGLSHTWHILPGLLPGLASCQLSPHSSHISTSCIVYLLLIEIVSPQSGHPTFMRASHPSPSPGLSLIGGILAKATNCCSTEGFQSRFCESAMDSNRPLLLRLPESVVYGPNSTGSADAEPSFRHELIGEPNTWYACLACLVDVVRNVHIPVP
ncbi:unnamed protein product [Protopolystoma xenopodis]|uniref:Uncharacterized protein n=1 Tax=Protopolystoma xenopodis TaxID=117903 RepID=A0A3S5ARQ3_9PLAT|nr:unnamed protein product [Protopolystoma xenopodis]